jgi:hypothetical protein
MSVFNRFERLPIPTIVAVQGHCFAVTPSSPSGPRSRRSA